MVKDANFTGATFEAEVIFRMLSVLGRLLLSTHISREK
jgi:hypothetical protein